MALTLNFHIWSGLSFFFLNSVGPYHSSLKTTIETLDISPKSWLSLGCVCLLRSPHSFCILCLCPSIPDNPMLPRSTGRYSWHPSKILNTPLPLHSGLYFLPVFVSLAVAHCLSLTCPLSRSLSQIQISSMFFCVHNDIRLPHRHIGVEHSSPQRSTPTDIVPKAQPHFPSSAFYLITFHTSPTHTQWKVIPSFLLT